MAIFAPLNGHGPCSIVITCLSLLELNLDLWPQLGNVLSTHKINQEIIVRLILSELFGLMLIQVKHEVARLIELNYRVVVFVSWSNLKDEHDGIVDLAIFTDPLHCKPDSVATTERLKFELVSGAVAVQVRFVDLEVGLPLDKFMLGRPILTGIVLCQG